MGRWLQQEIARLRDEWKDSLSDDAPKPSASERRMLMGTWVMKAWKKFCEEQHVLRNSAFERTGCLITLNGSRDKEIQPQAFEEDWYTCLQDISSIAQRLEADRVRQQEETCDLGDTADVERGEDDIEEMVNDVEEEEDDTAVEEDPDVDPEILDIDYFLKSHCNRRGEIDYLVKWTG